MCFVYVISLYKISAVLRSKNKDYAFSQKKKKIKEREREGKKSISFTRARMCVDGSYPRTLGSVILSWYPSVSDACHFAYPICSQPPVSIHLLEK